MASPQSKRKNLSVLKGSDVTRMIEDDELSLISDCSTSTNMSSATNSSVGSRRSKRNTPVREIRADSLPKLTVQAVRISPGKVSFTQTATASKFIVKGHLSSPNKCKISDTPSTPDKSSDEENNKRKFERTDTVSPKKLKADSSRTTRSTVSTPKTLKSVKEETLKEKSRTEPRRLSLAVCQDLTKDVPKTEGKVRRVQSVRIKRLGSVYQSFRNTTPDSEGQAVRTRLSDKFTGIKNADDLRKSGREVFTEMTNIKSSVAKSPKVRAAKMR